MAKTFTYSYPVCPDCMKGIHEHPGHDCKNLIPEGQCCCCHGMFDKEGNLIRSD